MNIEHDVLVVLRYDAAVRCLRDEVGQWLCHRPRSSLAVSRRRAAGAPSWLAASCCSLLHPPAALYILGTRLTYFLTNLYANYSRKLRGTSRKKLHMG
jgi:hypothetical protein